MRGMIYYESEKNKFRRACVHTCIIRGYRVRGVVYYESEKNKSWPYDHT